jgi:hypothetical protein
VTEAQAHALIEELVQLVSSWQPDFAAKIVGAPPELIARLEARMVEPPRAGSLPSDFVVLAHEHRAFLERMGENYEGINSYGDDVLDLRATALLEFNDDEYRVDPRQFVLCGAPSEFLVWPLMFDRRADVEPLPLVRFGGFDEEKNNQPLTMREHSSFGAMLFTFAFMRKCLPRFAWEQHLESPGTKQPRFPNCPPGRWLPHFAVIIRQLGFTSISHTGPWSVCAERADAAVMMYECPGFTPDVRVAAKDRVTLNNLVEVLSDNLELRMRPATLRQPS